MRNLVKVGLSSLVIAGSMFVVTPAQAVTQHCDTASFPNKVELGGDDASVHTNLPSRTEVCLKVGTQVTYVVVDFYGNVTNTSVTNQNGKAQGISYYAWGDEAYPS
ncbi:MAG: hypothetical protein IT193_17465 [Propionibacteriaceae bacterium]|nr:hypothetical protein [Propionibacteriaceae bacterium]